MAPLIPLSECKCPECEGRMAHVAAIKAIKASLPKPEWDWEDLARQSREVRERESRGVACPPNPPGSHPSHWKV